MKLKVLDQIQVTAVQPTVLTTGQEIEIDDQLGSELLKRNPRSFQVIEKTSTPRRAPVAEKAIIGAPKNKAESAAPANKAESKAKTKGD